jgi:hypothetical protein
MLLTMLYLSHFAFSSARQCLGFVEKTNRFLARGQQLHYILSNVPLL